MLTRIITAVVALALFVPVIAYGGTWGACILFAVICGISVYEMLMCCDLHKKWLVSIPSVLISIGIVLMPAILYPYSFLLVGFMLAAVAVVLVAFLFYGVLAHKVVDIERLMMFFALALYIIAGFASLATLRMTNGIWAVTYLLCVSWFTDTFAYFGGMLFGKKKLCPDISPKKTVAGAIVGTLFGTLSGVLIAWSMAGEIWIGIFALPFSIVSQLGDLSASIIKRRFGVKDYGKIFPGHGGVLDRFDSIIPTAIIGAVTFIGINVVAWII